MKKSPQTTGMARRAALLVASVLALFATPFLVKAWDYEGSIMSESTMNNPTGFGGNVAMSPSGSFLAVSSPVEADGAVNAAGAVRVFSLTDGKWTLMDTLKSAIPLNSGFFGLFTAMTDDQIIVSMSSAENEAGTIEVFSLSGSTWIPHQRILGSAPGDRLGSSLALSEDGSLLVSGAAGYDSERGCVKVYTLDSSSKWAEHATLSGATEEDSRMGLFTVSIDATMIVAGAPAENSGRGAAYLWARENTDITPTAQRLTTTTPLDEDDSFGYSSAILSSTTIAFAAVQNPRIFILTYSSTTNTWVQSSFISGPEGVFGFGFKLVFDSGRLFVSSFGSPCLYTVSGNTLSDSCDLLIPTEGAVGPLYGAFGLYLKGNKAIIGDGIIGAKRKREDEIYEGVHFFHVPLIQKVKSSGKSKSKGTGHKVAFWNDIALVSVPFCHDPTTTCDGGYINLYRKGTSPSTDWKFHKKVRNPFRNRENKFGYNMIVNDNYLIVSAPASTYIEQDVGIVALFTWSDGQDTFIKSSIIRYRKTTKQFNLGSALSNLNSVTAIGLPEYDESSEVTNSGSVLVFKKKDNGKWGQRKTITSPSPSTDENFGQSVSLQSETRIAVSNNPSDVSLQAVFIFDLTNGEWEFGQKIFDTDKLGFGWKILFHSDLLYISAIHDATTKADGGSITVYSADGEGEYEPSYTFQSDDVVEGEHFGFSFATDGSRFIVGTNSCLDSSTCTIKGSAYTFTKDSNDKWIQQYRLAYGAVDGSDGYGFDVAVSGDDVLISAPLDSSVLRPGVVYFVK